MDNEKDILSTETSLEEEHGRYAVSLLPRDMRNEAYNMECMVNHETGEFLVKDERGVVLSFDKYSRFTSHLNTFSERCKAKRITSKVYEIETNVNFPSIVNHDVNLLDSTLTFGVINTIDKIMVSIDLDTINKSSIISPVVLEDNKTKIEIVLTCGNIDVTKEFTKSQLNNNVFNIKELFPTVSNSADPIACKSIKIKTNDFDGANLICLVSSVLVSFI